MKLVFAVPVNSMKSGEVGAAEGTIFGLKAETKRAIMSMDEETCEVHLVHAKTGPPGSVTSLGGHLGLDRGS